MNIESKYGKTITEESKLGKKNFLLVRHGQSGDNYSDRLSEDPELTLLGRSEAKRSGLILSSIIPKEQVKAIIHTNLRRTYDTADIIKSSEGFSAPLISMPEFQERNMGSFVGISFASLLENNKNLQDLYSQYGNSCVWHFNHQGVESLVDMFTRVKKGVMDIKEQYGDEPVVLVGHAGSLKMVRYLYEKKEGDLAHYLSSFIPLNGDVYQVS